MSTNGEETQSGRFPSRTWADISLAAIAGNFRALDRLGSGAMVAAVVKADAYGHGLAPVARACHAAGARVFAVATLDEAAALRKAGINGEILLLAPLLPDEAGDAIRLDLTPLISSEAFFDAWATVSKTAPLPPRAALTVDTGMGREGLEPQTAVRLWRDAPAHIRLVGLTTHFGCADDDETAITDSQRAVFDRALGQIQPQSEIWLSLANSPGMLRGAGRSIAVSGNPFLDRPGALLYGIEPWGGALSGTGIRPALSWRARVTLIRPLPLGTPIGYGRTHTLSRDSIVATLAVGYADGLSRRLSNAGFVLLNGVRCPIVGRISMDQCQIDITDAGPVLIGDAATLLGDNNGATITALDMAEAAQTTSHEPTTTIGRRVTRRYTR